VHCRIVIALIGVVCIVLSFEAGFGLAYINGWKYTEMNDTVPFIMMGIGVDDMFVICNALD